MQDHLATQDRIRPISATLMPDGTIEVELVIPDQDDPAVVTVPATKASRWLTLEDDAQVIDLDDDSDLTATVRPMIDGYIVLVERYIAEQQARRGRGR